MNKLRKNVLIFPGGTENGLEIKRSLEHCKEVNLFSVSSATPNQAFYAYEDNSIIPNVCENGWIDALNFVIKQKNIDIIIPANSIVIDALNENRETIACDILLPDKRIIDITRSKRSTLETLGNVISIPRVFDKKEDVKQCDFPLFVKPDRGYGSQGAKTIYTFAELDNIEFKEYIVQEKLLGDEYTIDCFSDKGKILFARGRKRERIRMGTTMHCGELSEKEQIMFGNLAKKIGEILPINGFWFFQMKKDANDTLKLLEVDIRIAGTMAYHRCKGINFPLLALYQFYGMPVQIEMNTEYSLILDRCLKNTYFLNFDYKHVYIDLDDTIICHNKLNIQIIMFLYQCINDGKKIILLSKNSNEDDKLKKMRIYHIFDEIYWLNEEECKADYIKHKKAIFIDDSFSQRKTVKEQCGIPTFDASMVECLLYGKDN